MASVYEIKLHPPATRAEWLARPRLLRRLDEVAPAQLLLVAAPAGYGKSVLVAQWAAARSPTEVAWIQLDPADNDATRLWAHVAAALELVGCQVDVNVAEFVAMSSTAILSRVVPRVAEALAEHGRPLTIVLEDCHVLRSPECNEQLERLLDLLPPGITLLLVSRSDPRLRLGRLRVAGRLAEIRTADLAFTTDETATLLAAAGIRLSGDPLQELMRLTEGWPAAVYLTALSLQGRPDPDDFVRRLSGSDRFIADYLSEEVLGRLDTELRDFVLDMSVFDRFNASLANEAAQIDTAPRLLHQLERTNLFLIPLHGGGWFRFHHLFQTFARGALEVERPDRVVDLHRRGAHWLQAHDHVEEAIRHSLAAGDSDDAADLIQGNWLRFFDAGRSVTVHGWLQALRGTPADLGPAATVTGAWAAALTGDQREMRRRLTALEGMSSDAPLPDGMRSPRSALLLARGLFGYDGPDQLLADAAGAVELEDDPSSPWHAVACAALGHGGFVVGDAALTRRRLREAVESSVAPRTVQILGNAILSLCELEQGNPTLGRHHAQQAMEVVTVHSMQAMPNVLHAYTAYGASLAADGRLDEAVDTLETGLAVRRQTPGLSPWPLIHHLVALAGVRARLGDRDRAESLLVEVDACTPWPGASMATTRDRIAAARALLGTRSTNGWGPGEPLTPRELEILHRLGGTQTLREIASDLYVSHNTIKTITLSLYRKLGAHSRSEAVTIGHGRADG